MSLFFRVENCCPAGNSSFFDMGNTCLSATNAALILQVILKTSYDSELKAMTNKILEKNQHLFPRNRVYQFHRIKGKYFDSQMISITFLFIIVSVKKETLVLFIFCPN